MDQAKPLWKSKTFWLHILTMAATYGGLASNVLPPQAAAIALGVQGIAGIILRLVTDQPVTINPQSGPPR